MLTLYNFIFKLNIKYFKIYIIIRRFFMTITKCSLDNHLFALPISSHVTVGLAKMFGFEVLRHGTSYSNYFNILENGTDPNRGGATSSLGDGVKDNDPTYLRFHVFKDSNNNLGYCVPFVGHI